MDGDHEYDRYDNGVHVTYDGNTTHIATVYDRNDSSRCLTFTYNNDSPTAHITPSPISARLPTGRGAIPTRAAG